MTAISAGLPARIPSRAVTKRCAGCSGNCAAATLIRCAPPPPTCHALPRRYTFYTSSSHHTTSRPSCALRSAPTEGIGHLSSLSGEGIRPSEVYLVGTGPGDPELLTLKAYRLMQTADVVLYDRLVSEGILELIHPGARMVYVGKESGFHTRSQTEIHSMMLQFAISGQSVLRLKGGDPFIFGRGGEEQAYLQSAGIPVHVVPGITAAAGICAQLGIPLTHRGYATGVRYMTGHMREGAEDELLVSLAECRDPMTTLVFYMGLATLPTLRERLLAAGADPALPAVAVERGTTAEQREVWAPLGEFVEAVGEAGLRSPTLIIMGQVVALAAGWEGAGVEGGAVPLQNNIQSGALSSRAPVTPVREERAA